MDKDALVIIIGQPKRKEERKKGAADSLAAM